MFNVIHLTKKRKEKKMKERRKRKKETKYFGLTGFDSNTITNTRKHI